MLRLGKAFQCTETHGKVCPAGWKSHSDNTEFDIRRVKNFFFSQTEVSTICVHARLHWAACQRTSSVLILQKHKGWCDLRPACPSRWWEITLPCTGKSGLGCFVDKSSVVPVTEYQLILLLWYQLNLDSGKRRKQIQRKTQTRRETNRAL